MKVLIVEDNLVNQKVLQKQLKNNGTVVHLANHGGEALEKIMQSTYWRDSKGPEPKLELGVVLMGMLLHQRLKSCTTAADPFQTRRCPSWTA